MARASIAKIQEAIQVLEARGDMAGATALRRSLPETTTQQPSFLDEAEEIRAEARRRREERLAAQPVVPEETGFFEDITSGFGAGVVGVGEMAALGLAAPLEEQNELAAREKIQSIAESFRPEGGDPDSISYKLSSALGSIVGLAAVPAAAALTPVGAAGALGLGALAAGAAGTGEASERARAAGATEEERGDAALRGAFIGLLDIIPIARVLPTSKLPELAKLIDKIPPEKVETIGERIYSAGITGGAEAAQEAASNVLQNLNEQEYNAAAETFGGTAEEAALGGGAGAILQGFVDLFAPRRAKGPDPVTPVPTKETPVAPVTPVTEADVDAEAEAAAEEVTRLDADATLDEREQAEREEAEKEKLAAAIEAGEEKGAVTRTTQDGETTTTVQTEEQLRGQVGADTTANDSFFERVVGKNYKRTSIYRRYKDADLTDPDARDDLRREAAQPRKNKDQIQENLNKEFAALGPVKKEEVTETEVDAAEARAAEEAKAEEPDPLDVQISVAEQKLRDTEAQKPEKSAIQAALTASDPTFEDLSFAERKLRIDEDFEQQNVEYEANVAAAQKELDDLRIERTERVTEARTPIKEAEAELIEARGTEAEPEAVEGFNRAYEEVYGTPEEVSKREFIGRSRQTKAPPLPEQDQQAIQQFLTEYDALPREDKKDEAKAVADYLKLGEVTGDPAKGLTFAAYDVATGADRARQSREDPVPTEEAKLFAGMGREKGQAVLDWANANLSPTAQARIQETTQETKDVEFEQGVQQRRKERRDKNLVLTRALKKKAAGKRLTAEEARVAKEHREAKAPPSYTKKLTEPLESKKGKDASDTFTTQILPQLRRKAKEGDADAQRQLDERERDLEKERQANKDSLVLPKNASLSTTLPMPDASIAALRNGDLKGALEAVAADAPNPAVKRFARKLAENVGTTKVSLVEDLQNEGGDFVYGLFDPKTNTISLDAAEGQTVHALIHEMGHAGVSATVADPKNPLTIQLQKVFDDVKDKLKSHYGSQDIQEFASEYMSNPEFRSELALLSTPKAPSVLRKVADIIDRIVRKILGVPPKKSKEDSLTDIDNLIETIIAPAPEFRDAGQLLMASKEGGVGRVIDATARNASRIGSKVPKQDFVEAVDFISTLRDRGTRGVQGIGLGFLNNSAFNDVADVINIPSIKNFTRAIETSNGAVDTVNKRLNSTTADIERKLKAARKQFPDRDILTIFNRLTTDSTMDRVDPSKPESDYKTPKKKAAWKRLNAEYQKLGPDGQAAYVQLRDTYKDILEDLRKSLEVRIDSVVADKTEAAKLKDTIVKRLLDKNMVDPYFPLAREGDYWLKWFVVPTNPDGTKGQPEEVIEAYTSPNARDRAQASLSAIARGEAEPIEVDGATFTVSGIEPFNGNNNMKFEGGAPPTAFATQMVNTLSQAGVESDTINSIVQEFVSALPESSFLKAFKQREDKFGAKDDALYALRTKGYGMARRAANMRSAENIRGSLEQVFEDLKAAPRSRISDNFKEALKSELEARKELTINPPDDFFNNAAKELNRIAFFGTMGFNAASTIANAFQLPAVVVPFLQGKTDFKTATRAMNAARRMFTGSAIEHRVMPYGDGDVVTSDKNFINSYTPSIDNYYLLNKDGELQLRNDLPDLDTPNYYQNKTKRQFLEELMPVVQEAENRGFLTRSLWADQMGADMAGTPQGSLPRRFYENLTKWSALPFHTVERGNRQMTVVASYLTEMSRLENNPDKAKGEDKLSDTEKKTLATQVAMQDTSQLNGGSALNTAPRFAQGTPVGRLAMMFKTYGFTMYYNQFKMMASALKQAREYGLSEEQGRIAMKQFIASNGTIAAIAGVQGIPLVGIFQGIADLFLEDDEEDADLLSRRFIGDPLYRGGVQYLTNFAGAEVDIAARIGLSNLILGNNRYDFSKSAKEEFVDFIGGPALGYASSIGRGINDVANGETRRGIESMLPSAFRNMLQAERFATEGAQTRRGDPITDDFNTGEIATKFFGFAPASYTNAQERNQDTKKIEKTVSRQKTKLLKRLYVAVRQGDDTSEILNEIAEHNKEHGSKGTVALITYDTILRSMKQHVRTSAKMHDGITLTPVMRAYAQDMQEELEYQPWYMNN